ncbi:divalent-cation tolerance protein CutA [Streptosporangium canum]|uniref:divalent-cation tolerance protein CutA n=1 Tax=Streptosporangium canum TaxID=324952 RepID=UPI0037BA4023
MLQNASDFLEVRVTVGSREEADRICSAVVGQRLAADCQIIAPIESTYWRAGEIQRSEEWLLLMKTTIGRFEDLARRVWRNSQDLWTSPLRGQVGSSVCQG